MHRAKRLAKKIFFLLFVLMMSVSTAIGAERNEETIYHGNQKSYVYHAPDCRYYNCKNCTIELKSKSEANEKGFRPCKICTP